ncbi:MAG: hypothetical protein RBT66_07030 [bacterium]|jgi:hypothetical protein|nr:hypothetical protein [bacterium]
MAGPTRDELMKLRTGTVKKPYDVPGIGTVYVHGLKHIEAKQWRSAQTADDVYGDAKMLIRSVRDAEGQPIFKTGDETLIVEWPEWIVQDLLGLCMEVNGIRDDPELRKNFAATLASGS